MDAARDDVASKMNALVNRGLSRDFLDIHRVCLARLATPELCWELWQTKNPDGKLAAAKQNVLLHLKRIETRRPLQRIPDAQASAQAEDLRAWFRNTFLQ
jgi:hypothetical protein